MSTWVLILTISAVNSYGGSAVASVPGFKSDTECLAAANAWLDTSRRASNGYAVTFIALCVKA